MSSMETSGRRGGRRLPHFSLTELVVLLSAMAAAGVVGALA